MDKVAKKDQCGITNHIVLIAIAVIMVSVIGFAGYKVYKSKNSVKAHAAYGKLAVSYSDAQGRPTRPNPNVYPTLSACYTPVTGAYGPLYRVQAQANDSNLPASLKTKIGFSLSTFQDKDQPPLFQNAYAAVGRTATVFVQRGVRAGFNVSYSVGNYGGAWYSTGNGGRLLVTSLSRC